MSLRAAAVVTKRADAVCLKDEVATYDSWGRVVWKQVVQVAINTDETYSFWLEEMEPFYLAAGDTVEVRVREESV